MDEFSTLSFSNQSIHSSIMSNSTDPSDYNQQQQQQQQEAIERATNLFSEEQDVNMEDEDEVLPASFPQQQMMQPSFSAAATTTIQQTLLDRIITPSPFPQHNTGTSRFRTAFSRILADPVNDTEAWLAVIAESSTCYASILGGTESASSSSLAAPDQYAKLDWVESCYGALIYRFPYAVTHVTGVADILRQQIVELRAALAQSMHTSSNSNSSIILYEAPMKQRLLQCRAKLSRIFQTHLGIAEESILGQDTTPDDATQTPPVHRLALGAWVVELWLVYVKHVQHDAATAAVKNIANPSEISLAEREAGTAAYDRAVTAAGDGHNNHLLWNAYRSFVQSWVTVSPLDGGTNVDHALASKQMQQLRSVYQRAIVQPMLGLDTYWQEYESFEKQQSEALAAALIQEFAPKYQHARSVYLERNRVMSSGDVQLGRLATPPVPPVDQNNNENEYHGKLLDEYHLLRLWKVRCSYERTNPGRLGTTDLSRRIRNSFCEMACTLTRHPETWHMWSTWELLQAGVSTVTVGPGPDGWPASVQRSLQVLKLGQKHIPDATLLAYAEAQLIETYNPSACQDIMESFLERSPNTLGFVLLQQLVRRHKGKEPARIVFARARKTLSTSSSTKTIFEEKSTDKGDNDGEKTEGQTGKKMDEENGNRWIVTNRLDETIGAGAPLVPKTGENGDKKLKTMSGGITWHLFAAHAEMEHRLNREPEIAARVYELGLRKHATFLTVTPYVQRYAQLLLELNDILNLRALLTRAVAACEAGNKQSALASLWDTRLHFESVSGADPASIGSLQRIEQRRHEVLMGPDLEDVATGGIAGTGDSALIGAQKSTIAEQLIRTEGYDVSSRIVNGLKRTVGLLGVMGIWGTADIDAKSRKRHTKVELSIEFSGGTSDAAYYKRLQFEQSVQAGFSPDSVQTDMVTGSKLLTARERLALATGAGGPTGVLGGTAIMLSIQQSADWLRPLLLLLPASQLRLPIVAKPPPHLTEMALSAMRQNALPAERPTDDVSSKSTKRSLATNNDGSSDEEDGVGSSGYGAAFRARQRARMEQNGTTHLN